MESEGAAGYKRPKMDDWYILDIDPAHAAREREKARALRKTAWWQRRLSRGLCAYCEKPHLPAELTMDHIVPVARGGRSSKGNVVPACKECNNKKKLMTPAEQLLMAAKQIEED
jgi:5-methylcytosine-specific restriction protein A